MGNIITCILRIERKKPKTFQIIINIKLRQILTSNVYKNNKYAYIYIIIYNVLKDHLFNKILYLIFFSI